ncbi:MAG: hypothetical protein MK085_05680, partial [Phycisphaerales bacterium]|nr:hypothetical protein [Phycisphaerales bacterium]
MTSILRNPSHKVLYVVLALRVFAACTSSAHADFSTQSTGPETGGIARNLLMMTEFDPGSTNVLPIVVTTSGSMPAARFAHDMHITPPAGLHADIARLHDQCQQFDPLRGLAPDLNPARAQTTVAPNA